jgi:hypothetical protein
MGLLCGLNKRKESKTMVWLSLASGMMTLSLLLWNIPYISCAFIYVNSLSNTSRFNCGQTFETACPNIATALDIAFSNDIISLQPGIYSGFGNENLDPQNISITGLTIFGNGTQGDEDEGQDDGRDILIQCINKNRFLHAENNLIHQIENISIKNCTALVTTIRNIGNGGALSFSNSDQTIYLKNLYFEWNLGRSGGAITVTSGSLSIINCSFHNNHAGYWGGAIASVRSGITISNSLFSKNSVNGDIIVDPKLQLETTEAGRGGAIHANGGSRMIIRNTHFFMNTGQVAGGALFAKLVSGLEITSCHYEQNLILGSGLCDSENLCDVRGGAMYINDVAVTLTDSTFLQNAAITQDLSQVS